MTISILLSGCTSSEQKKRQELQAEIDEINFNLASSKINDFIIFDSCRLQSNNDIYYYYTITDSTLHKNSLYFKNLEKEIKELTKYDTGLQTIRNYNITTKYTYNRNGDILYSFDVTPEDYK